MTTDIVERLQWFHEHGMCSDFRLIYDAEIEIERLTAEVAEWKERWAAERHDHEATMKAWDEERSGL